MLIVVALISLLVHPTPASATTKARVVVKVRSGSVHAAGTGAHVVADVSSDTSVVEEDNRSSASLAAELKARPDVEWAEPDVEYRAFRTPNDPCVSTSACVAGFTQANIAKIGLPAAWDVTTGDPITVAILDSGVDATHPDLQGRVTIGANFSTDANDLDEDGHGTHVAGIVGAITDNGVGVAGADWNARILSVKSLDSNGNGTASAVAQALRYATDHGARIANLSLGGAFSQAMADAVEYAESRGVLVVAAAGNNSSSTPVYPAALPGVLSVGWSTPSDTVAGQSNRGTWVKVVAPGTNVVSTYPTNLDPSDPYAAFNGSSMSTPLVAGVAALLWSARPYMSWTGIENRITETAQQISGSGTLVASGRVDAAAALSRLGGGYRLVASDGGIFAFGGASFEGSTGGAALNSPIATAMSDGDPDGYWLVGRDGGVYTFGDASFWGSAGGSRLNAPIVAAAATRSGNGYWLCAADGGIFSYGDAQFFGSTGSLHLNKPIVAMIPTASGRGYWLIASDGGVFSFGDAQFYGSTGGLKLNKPIVGAARTHNGDGYWLVASDGGIFSFGDAQFYGSTGSLKLVQPVVSISPSPTGDGYWLIAADGGVFSFGDASFQGSTGGIKLNRPIVTSVG